LRALNRGPLDDHKGYLAAGCIGRCKGSCRRVGPCRRSRRDLCRGHSRRGRWRRFGLHRSRHLRWSGRPARRAARAVERIVEVG
jgi:hypothetical protein